MIGREAEIEELGKALRVCRLVAIKGGPGEGKSRLAYELIAGLLTDAGVRLDRVAFVDLGEPMPRGAMCFCFVPCGVAPCCDTCCMYPIAPSKPHRTKHCAWVPASGGGWKDSAHDAAYDDIAIRFRFTAADGAHRVRMRATLATHSCLRKLGPSPLLAPDEL